MVSRKLMASWAFLDFCLLAAGALSVAFSIIWRKQDIMLNMVISNSNLMAGMVLGIMLLVTFVVSIGAVVQKNHVTMGFVILNWFLVVDILSTVIIGTFVWFYTLQERNNFRIVYGQLPAASRIFIQDANSCCGYETGNEFLEIGGTHCVSQDFVNALDPNDTSKFCITPVTTFADVTLNDIFTVIYGFVAVGICLFLASMCVIRKRQEDERFMKIDAKRGGRGFV